MASVSNPRPAEENLDKMVVETTATDESEASTEKEAPTPRPRPANSERKRRGSVSAPPMGAISENFVCKSYPKSPEINTWLKDAISKIFLFSNTDEPTKDVLVDAFFEVRQPANQLLIRQGDDGDNFYFVYSGECDIFVDQDLVMTATSNDYFGELALMYHTKRAATVRSSTDVVLYGLDQETFNYVLRTAGQGRRKEYDEFLQSVPLLQSLCATERGKVADVLRLKSHNDGDYIIKQGDQHAEVFYLLYEGSAVATKADDSGTAQQVSTYDKGDYFGELALLHGPPRRANVIAKGAQVRTRWGTGRMQACMDRSVFRRLLGSCMPHTTELRQRYGLADTDLTGTGERCSSPWRRRRGSNDSEGGAGADRDRSPGLAPADTLPSSAGPGSSNAMDIGDHSHGGSLGAKLCPDAEPEQVRPKKQRVAV